MSIKPAAWMRPDGKLITTFAKDALGERADIPLYAPPEDAEFQVLSGDKDEMYIVAGSSGPRLQALSESMTYALNSTDPYVVVEEVIRIKVYSVEPSNE